MLIEQVPSARCRDTPAAWLAALTSVCQLCSFDILTDGAQSAHSNKSSQIGRPFCVCHDAAMLAFLPPR